MITICRRARATRSLSHQRGERHAMLDEKCCTWSAPDLGQAKAPALVDIVCQMVFRLGFPLARIWWGLLRPRHQGALVAIHVGQSLLLLRSSYQSAWTFPGGGIRQGERPKSLPGANSPKRSGLWFRRSRCSSWARFAAHGTDEEPGCSSFCCDQTSCQLCGSITARLSARDLSRSRIFTRCR